MNEAMMTKFKGVIVVGGGVAVLFQVFNKGKKICPNLPGPV